MWMKGVDEYGGADFMLGLHIHLSETQLLSPLCPSLPRQNNFERNMTDIFMVKAKDVGELTRIVVGKGGQRVQAELALCVRYRGQRGPGVGVEEGCAGEACGGGRLSVLLLTPYTRAACSQLPFPPTIPSPLPPR